MMEFIFDDEGITVINSSEAREILEAISTGEITKQRATHIVPQNPIKRLAFRTIRWLSGDGKRLRFLENWTRFWKGQQVVDLRPSGGPVVPGFANRQEAIAWEIKWLRENL